MRNERGITLIELLAVLALIGIIITLIVSVLINGMNASKRNTTNQRLQQDANYIVEMIRNNYLKNESDINEEVPISLKIENSGKKLLMDNKVLSEGYIFQLNDGTGNELFIDRDLNVPLKLTLSKDKLSFTVNTTLSKIR